MLVLFTQNSFVLQSKIKKKFSQQSQSQVRFEKKNSRQNKYRTPFFMADSYV